MSPSSTLPRRWTRLPLTAARLGLVGVVLLGGRAAQAQQAAAAEAEASIGIQHSFPLAGGTLVLVVDGLVPREAVVLELSDPADAPPSVRNYLTNGPAEQWRGPLLGSDMLRSAWQADALGRIALTIPLADADDANRSINLRVMRQNGSLSTPLLLQVQPPTLVVKAADGLQRISLLDGSVLLPAIPADGGLRSLALSADGKLGYVLRDGGLLELRSTYHWDAEPLSRRTLDPAADVLASSLAGGAAFAVARLSGAPYTPDARLLFIDETRAPLLLEPMGQEVKGRRVVLTPDGLSAFVAEDNLIVREVDLLSAHARALLTVGLAGDGAIADMVLDGRRLLVATRGPLGRRGSLTSFDLDSGTLLTYALRVDPLRLVPLHDGTVLVVPAAGGRVELVESGVPTTAPEAFNVRFLDAVARNDGALLLGEAVGGARVLLSFDPLAGQFAPLIVRGVPPVTRLVSAVSADGGTRSTGGAVVLLGDPSGAVHVLRAGDALDTVPGVLALPGETFAVLP